MKTHTTLDLDRDLLVDAAAGLGTTRTTETVHAALREAVARQARVRLMARDWSNLNVLMPEMRAPRPFLPQAEETAAQLEDFVRRRDNSDRNGKYPDHAGSPLTSRPESTQNDAHEQ